ncbi:hypothetical protein U756_00330 [Streptococcus pneumoniae 27]|nr:Conserved hypothetical protein [Streptococcus pneumoniae R6]ACB89497.1 hypothetical protein SPCG_0245 [Streptococcus pneumoniae CGSP14]AGZ47060.1 hypothetical protein T308_01160 [Streptococcus pneumoniae A026]ETE03257.1 hypothetical protein U756_00330 [Streptococcus pneumoniae 27]ETE25937.1 hypothetical protein U755_06770 [Streptococcus pneumoniae 1719]OLV91471.1 Hypothetical protein SPCCCB_spr0217 [Streptococcus pneumoniae CCCB]CAG5138836.1 ACT domain-containing protein [Streptococcus pne
MSIFVRIMLYYLKRILFNVKVSYFKKNWSLLMKAIITVVGKDKSGIVAGVSGKIAELGLNIDDISQTVLDEYFTMMAVVSSDEKQDFTYLRNEFEAFGQTLNVKINIQSAAIFEAMYNI